MDHYGTEGFILEEFGPGVAPLGPNSSDSDLASNELEFGGDVPPMTSTANREDSGEKKKTMERRARKNRGVSRARLDL